MLKAPSKADMWPRIDPKWADPGRSGVVNMKGGRFIVFTVLSSTVNGADVLFLETNMDYAGYTTGSKMTFSWTTEFWHLAKEIE